MLMGLLAQTAPLFADKGLLALGAGLGAGLICIGSARESATWPARRWKALPGSRKPAAESART